MGPYGGRNLELRRNPTPDGAPSDRGRRAPPSPLPQTAEAKPELNFGLPAASSFPHEFGAGGAAQLVGFRVTSVVLACADAQITSSPTFTLAGRVTTHMMASATSDGFR